MRRFALAAALTALLAAQPLQAFAWGPEGHRIIAALAYERLTPKARQAVDQLISHSAEQGTPSCEVRSIEDAATWPDCVRPLPQFHYLAAMHFEDVPICGTEPKAVYCPGGRCVSDETTRALAVLKDQHRPAVERLQALEEVVHFIGDLHQPLHAANNNDRGGNQVKVQVDGREENLHHVWDDDVVFAAVGSSEPSAVTSLQPLAASNASAWSQGDIDQWVAESHQAAVSYVYAKLPTPPACGTPAASQTLPDAYLRGAAPLVRRQLAKAGVRLALVLNRALQAGR